MGKEKDYRFLSKLGQASSIGIVMVVSTLIGFLFGSWLDKKFETDPWLMILFTLLGVAAGFRELILMAIRLSK